MTFQVARKVCTLRMMRDIWHFLAVFSVSIPPSSFPITLSCIHENKHNIKYILALKWAFQFISHNTSLVLKEIEHIGTYMVNDGDCEGVRR